MGERLLHSPAGVKDGGLEFREPAAERRIGRVVRDDEGWCVTMKGVLLVLCLGLCCSVSERGVLLALAPASWTFFR